MATKEVLTETREGVEYELTAVKHGKPAKCVGLAPTKQSPANVVSPDDILDWMLTEYGAEAIVKCFDRQNKQDVKNIVRGKYNKDKVSAATVINAIGDGRITAEMQQKAVKEVAAGKHKTFTDACATYLGIGEDALKNADPKHIHWNCAR